MDGLELLRARNRFDETLPSGLNVTLRLPRIRDCIIAGGVPLPVVQHLVETAGKGQDNGEVATLDDAAHMARFQDEIVRRSVVAIEGQLVSLELADIAEFSQEDYERIVKVATRETALPKAAVPTP